MAYTKRVSLFLGLATFAVAYGAFPAQANVLEAQDINAVLASHKTNKVAINLDPSADGASQAVDVPEVNLLSIEVESAAGAAEEPTSLPFDADVSTSAALLMDPAADEDLSALAGFDDSHLTLALESSAVEVDSTLSEGLELAQSTRPAYQGMPPAYFGVGGNLGIGDGDTALSDFGFVVLSKLSLGPRFALRPAAVIAEKQTSFLVPITYVFNVYEVGGFRFQPFVGAGADIPTDGDVGLLLDAGVDVPISRDFTLNATTNFRVTDDFGFGLVVGVGYNFPWIFE